MTKTKNEAVTGGGKAPRNDIERAWTITLTDRLGNRFYLYRYGKGTIHFVSKSETPNALANIAEDGARFRLELERANTAGEALQVTMNLATYGINAEIV
jgi:hypothetical protein